jgi:hypothetical protein
MTTKSAEGDAARSVMWGLTCLDAEIRATTGGVPGSGIYGLLDQLAGQFLGVPRGAFPPEIPPVDPPADDPPAREALKEPEKHDPPAKPHAGGNHRR